MDVVDVMDKDFTGPATDVFLDGADVAIPDGLKQRLFMSDGATGQVNSSRDTLAHMNEVNGIDDFKNSAQRSLDQNALDAGHCFSDQKRLVREMNEEFKQPFVSPVYMDRLMGWLAKVIPRQPGTLRTIGLFMGHLPAIISRSFSKDKIQRSWVTTGFIRNDGRMDYQRVMSRSAQYQNLTALQSKQLLEVAFPKCVDDVRKVWYIDDEVLHKHTADILMLPPYKVANSLQLKQPNEQYALQARRDELKRQLLIEYGLGLEQRKAATKAKSAATRARTKATKNLALAALNEARASGEIEEADARAVLEEVADEEEEEEEEEEDDDETDVSKT
jgi:hypothetical protein